MDDQPANLPRIVIHGIPKIEVYFVTEDELNRLEEGCSNIGQDLQFATVSLSLVCAFIIALLTTTMSESVRQGFGIAVAICVIVFLYAGARWWRARKITPPVISRIRKREDDPAPNPE